MRLYQYISIFICIFAAGLSAWVVQFFPFDEHDPYWHPVGHERLEDSLRDNLSSDLDTIEALALALHTRRPRMAFPRGVLASVYATQNNIEELERIFLPLIKVDFRNAAQYTSVLAQMSVNPKIKASVFDVLQTEKPTWGGQYLGFLFEHAHVNPEEYFDLMGQYPKSRAGYFYQIMQSRDLETAFEAFQHSNAVAGYDIGDIADPYFNDTTLGWPFGWWLNHELTQREQSGGVSIIYYGRDNPYFLRQLIRVNPIDYNIHIKGYSTGGRNKGFFRLEAKCWQGPLLADTAFETLAGSDGAGVLSFSTAGVDDCDFVMIQLQGQAGAYPSPVRLNIDSLHVTKSQPAGGSN